MDELQSLGIGSNYEYKNRNAQICVLPSVVKKEVVVASVSSMEAFPTIGLALQVEVPMAVASIPGPKVGGGGVGTLAWMPGWRRW
jgi:ABC-type methionine transport system permease subunit